ncbi:MAG: hypothetical protein WC294_11200 [Methanoregula sp.]|jgi:hypothetical protein
MDDGLTNLAFGIIFLILIINTTMLMSIASSLYEPSPGQSITPPQSPSYPVLAASADPDPVKPLISLIPTLVPLGNQGAALPDTDVVLSGSETNPVIKSISSYVTIETKEAPEIETHTLIQPIIAQKYEEGYVTIYSLTDQEISQVLPIVSFSLLNPPLVIDYDVTPINATDIKYVEYKEVATVHQENIVINRPYEDTWFMIIVRNKDTGQLITEDGFGRIYSFQTPRQLVLRENGNYSFEFTGDYANLNLAMKVKQEGNFP